MKVRIEKRTQTDIQSRVLRIKDELYPNHDFYEKVAEHLGWKGKEDALLWLSKNNYIKIERVEDEIHNL